MLTKAILTGGVLSALAGGIVYFGTSGADALTGEKAKDIRIEETELAGGPELAAVAEVDSSAASVIEMAAKAEDLVENSDAIAAEAVADEATKFVAPQEAAMAAKEDPAPKTKWLDQYLKKTKPEAEAKPDTETKPEMADESEKEDASMASDMMKTLEMQKAKMTKADAMEAEAEMEEGETAVQADDMADAMPEGMKDKADAKRKPRAERKRRMRMRMKRHMEAAEADAAAPTPEVMMKDQDTETGDIEIDIDAIDLDALDLEGDIDVNVIKKQLGLDGKENVEIRVIKKTKGKSSHSSKAHSKKAQAKRARNQRPIIDYDAVLVEANKLPVVDMRNQAVLEIIDYAVDNRDMAEAADFVPELSTPELRDTARARIGAGLARCGKAEAAFAVINELEIDELAAPIRLEIITALMATSQERKAAGFRN